MLVRISSKVGESEDGNSLRDPERGEAECRQTQVDDQHDFMTLHNYFDIRTDTMDRELQERLDANKWNML